MQLVGFERTRAPPNKIIGTDSGGHLHRRWTEWLGGLSVSHGDDGTTTRPGPIADQAALLDMLNKIRNLGLQLRLVQYIAISPD